MAIRSGAAYIAGLRDGRAVWQGGRRIDDVTVHPGFSGTVATLAALYDKQSQPEWADVMTVVTGGERMSYSYLPPATPDELVAKRRNIEVWSGETLGLMGRFPEFCAELVVGLLDYAVVLAADEPRWADNARAYHRHCVANDLCLTHALTDQYYDRSKRAGEQADPDLILHVVGETRGGPVVRGLRTLATLAPLADEVIVYPNRAREKNEADYAVAFAIPLATPGVQIVCRDLYAEHADPQRQPLTARFDEVDAAIVFDDVVVPWERVFVYRDPARVAGLHRQIRLWGMYSTTVRLIVRLETFLGIAQLLARWSGRERDGRVQELLGGLIGDIQVLRACIQAAESNAFQTAAGYCAPNIPLGYRLHGIGASDRAAQTMQELLTSSLVMTGGVSDLSNPEIGGLVGRYFRGGAPSTAEHLRLLAMAGDLVLSQFAMRGQLYERLQTGEPERIRQTVAAGWKDTAPVDRVRRFLEQMEREGRSDQPAQVR